MPQGQSYQQIATQANTNDSMASTQVVSQSTDLSSNKNSEISIKKDTVVPTSPSQGIKTFFHFCISNY